MQTCSTRFLSEYTKEYESISFQKIYLDLDSYNPIDCDDLISYCEANLPKIKDKLKEFTDVNLYNNIYENIDNQYKILCENLDPNHLEFEKKPSVDIACKIEKLLKIESQIHIDSIFDYYYLAQEFENIDILIELIPYMFNQIGIKSLITLISNLDKAGCSNASQKSKLNCFRAGFLSIMCKYPNILDLKCLKSINLAHVEAIERLEGKLKSIEILSELQILVDRIKNLEKCNCSDVEELFVEIKKHTLVKYKSSSSLVNSSIFGIYGICILITSLHKFYKENSFEIYGLLWSFSHIRAQDFVDSENLEINHKFLEILRKDSFLLSNSDPQDILNLILRILFSKCLMPFDRRVENDENEDSYQILLWKKFIPDSLDYFEQFVSKAENSESEIGYNQNFINMFMKSWILSFKNVFIEDYDTIILQESKKTLRIDDYDEIMKITKRIESIFFQDFFWNIDNLTQIRILKAYFEVVDLSYPKKMECLNFSETCKKILQKAIHQLNKSKSTIINHSSSEKSLLCCFNKVFSFGNNYHGSLEYITALQDNIKETKLMNILYEFFMDNDRMKFFAQYHPKLLQTTFESYLKLLTEQSSLNHETFLALYNCSKFFLSMEELHFDSIFDRMYSTDSESLRKLENFEIYLKLAKNVLLFDWERRKFEPYDMNCDFHMIGDFWDKEPYLKYVQNYFFELVDYCKSAICSQWEYFLEQKNLESMELHLWTEKLGELSWRFSQNLAFLSKEAMSTENSNVITDLFLSPLILLFNRNATSFEDSMRIVLEKSPDCMEKKVEQIITKWISNDDPHKYDILLVLSSQFEILSKPTVYNLVSEHAFSADEYDFLLLLVLFSKKGFGEFSKSIKDEVLQMIFDIFIEFGIKCVQILPSSDLKEATQIITVIDGLILQHKKDGLEISTKDFDRRSNSYGLKLFSYYFEIRHNLTQNQPALIEDLLIDLNNKDLSEDLRRVIQEFLNSLKISDVYKETYFNKILDWSKTEKNFKSTVAELIKEYNIQDMPKFYLKLIESEFYQKDLFEKLSSEDILSNDIINKTLQLLKKEFEISLVNIESKLGQPVEASDSPTEKFSSDLLKGLKTASSNYFEFSAHAIALDNQEISKIVRNRTVEDFEHLINTSNKVLDGLKEYLTQNKENNSKIATRVVEFITIYMILHGTEFSILISREKGENKLEDKKYIEAKNRALSLLKTIKAYANGEKISRVRGFLKIYNLLMINDPDKINQILSKDTLFEILDLSLDHKSENYFGEDVSYFCLNILQSCLSPLLSCRYFISAKIYWNDDYKPLSVDFEHNKSFFELSNDKIQELLAEFYDFDGSKYLIEKNCDQSRFIEQYIQDLSPSSRLLIKNLLAYIVEKTFKMLETEDTEKIFRIPQIYLVLSNLISQFDFLKYIICFEKIELTQEKLNLLPGYLRKSLRGFEITFLEFLCVIALPIDSKIVKSFIKVLIEDSPTKIKNENNIPLSSLISLSIRSILKSCLNAKLNEKAQSLTETKWIIELIKITLDYCYEKTEERHKFEIIKLALQWILHQNIDFLHCKQIQKFFDRLIRIQDFTDNHDIENNFDISKLSVPKELNSSTRVLLNKWIYLIPDPQKKFDSRQTLEFEEKFTLDDDGSLFDYSKPDFILYSNLEANLPNHNKNRDLKANPYWIYQFFTDQSKILKSEAQFILDTIKENIISIALSIIPTSAEEIKNIKKDILSEEDKEDQNENESSEQIESMPKQEGANELDQNIEDLEKEIDDLPDEEIDETDRFKYFTDRYIKDRSDFDNQIQSFKRKVKFTREGLLINLYLNKNAGRSLTLEDYKSFKSKDEFERNSVLIFLSLDKSIKIVGELREILTSIIDEYKDITTNFDAYVKFIEKLNPNDATNELNKSQPVGNLLQNEQNNLEEKASNDDEQDNEIDSEGSNDELNDIKDYLSENSDLNKSNLALYLAEQGDTNDYEESRPFLGRSLDPKSTWVTKQQEFRESDRESHFNSIDFESKYLSNFNEIATEEFLKFLKIMFSHFKNEKVAKRIFKIINFYLKIRSNQIQFLDLLLFMIHSPKILEIGTPNLKELSNLIFQHSNLDYNLKETFALNTLNYLESNMEDDMPYLRTAKLSEKGLNYLKPAKQEFEYEKIFDQEQTIGSSILIRLRNSESRVVIGKHLKFISKLISLSIERTNIVTEYHSSFYEESFEFMWKILEWRDFNTFKHLTNSLFNSNNILLQNLDGFAKLVPYLTKIILEILSNDHDQHSSNFFESSDYKKVAFILKTLHQTFHHAFFKSKFHEESPSISSGTDYKTVSYSLLQVLLDSISSLSQSNIKKFIWELISSQSNPHQKLIIALAVDYIGLMSIHSELELILANRTEEVLFSPVDLNKNSESDREILSKIFGDEKFINNLTIFFQKNEQLFDEIALTEKFQPRPEVALLVAFVPELFGFSSRKNLMRALINSEEYGIDATKYIDTSRERVPQNFLRFCKKASELKELRNPIDITFIDEEGYDLGGLKKEFYNDLVNKFFDPKFGLFKYTDQGNSLTISSDSFILPRYLEYFQASGIALAKAIVSDIAVDLSLPKFLLKHLLGKKLCLEDLADLDGNLGKSIQFLMETNEIEQLELTFTIEVVKLGTKISVELVEGGSEIKVTQENKLEYVQRFCDYIMIESISPQIKSFITGFRQILPLNYINYLKPEDLDLLISGYKALDIQKLKQNTLYKGFNPTDEVIIWFWDTLNDMNESHQRDFLKFLTGSPRMNIGSMESNPLKISLNSNDKNRLPVAHTCFNEIDLPKYESKMQLESKLWQAISECPEGFYIR